jgi:hypothetical protein
MAFLSKRIHDKRLLRFIQYRLESGIMEDWRYRKTYSGTPQGGVLSPLLANIYLHELDRYVEEMLLPVWNRGKKRAGNSAYNKVKGKRAYAKRCGDWETYKAMTKELRQLPSQDMHDPHFRRLKYVRYADDFLLGFIGTKAEAEAVLRQIEAFLEAELGFQVSRRKSKVTHAKSELAQFLGYGVGVYANIADKITGARRSANGRVMLRLPPGYVARKSREWERKGNPRIDGNALAYSVEEALRYYQTKFRGIVNYYRYAVDVHELGRLKYAMERSLTHTLSSKLKISVRKVYRKYSTYQEVDGRRYKVLQSIIVNEETGKQYTFTWGGIPLRRRYIVNEALQDNIAYGYHGSGELVARLLANECELCGKVTRELEGHHVHKLKDLEKRWKNGSAPYWVFVMTARRRKTLFVCLECHNEIHSQR